MMLHTYFSNFPTDLPIIFQQCVLFTSRHSFNVWHKEIHAASQLNKIGIYSVNRRKINLLTQNPERNGAVFVKNVLICVADLCTWREFQTTSSFIQPIELAQRWRCSKMEMCAVVYAHCKKDEEKKSISNCGESSIFTNSYKFMNH